MTEKKYTHDLVSYATFGINENIDAGETVEVSLRDLLIVKATLQELIQFFHNRDHYPTIQDVHDYMGGRGNSRAYDLISSSNYDLLRGMLPKHVDDLFDDGAFDSPEMPFYFKPKS